MLAQHHRRWANNSPALGWRLVFDRLQDRRRESHKTKLTDTKLIGQTNERWEVKQYISTSLKGRHNNKLFYSAHRPTVLCALYKQLKISVTEKMLLQGAFEDIWGFTLNPGVRSTALALHWKNFCLLTVSLVLRGQRCFFDDERTLLLGVLRCSEYSVNAEWAS